MNYCDCPNCKTDDCPSGAESYRIDEAYQSAFNELKSENARLRDALSGIVSYAEGIALAFADNIDWKPINEARDILSNASREEAK